MKGELLAAVQLVPTRLLLAKYQSKGWLLRNIDDLEYLADSYDSYSPLGHIDFDRVVERVKEQARIVSQPPCCTHSNA